LALPIFGVEPVTDEVEYLLAEQERIIMEDDVFLKNSRIRDPYVDRRSGEDRRLAYDSDYFEDGGLERRKHDDRRQPDERRESCIRVSRWTSVCPD